MLENGVLELPKHRLDLIYRNNLQGNYMAGKWERFIENAGNRPYLMYDAINDSRVRISHLALDGIIRRWDDPFWRTHSCPNGHRCRCSILSLTEAQAQARSNNGKGLNQQPTYVDKDGLTKPANPDKGWDYNPSDRMAGVYRAMEGKKDGVLLSALSSKLGATMQVIRLDGFDVVQDTFRELAIANPTLFNHETPEIHAVGNDSFFAATDGKDIFISAAAIMDNGFIPAVALAEAFKQVSRGRALSFQQEYAIEILQHEMVHLTTHKTNTPNRNKGVVVETLVQLLARSTYPKLLENAMGGLCIKAILSAVATGMLIR